MTSVPTPLLIGLVLVVAIFLMVAFVAVISRKFAKRKAAGEPNSVAHVVQDAIHFLRVGRIIQIFICAFIVHITWDFHQMYMDKILVMKDWQHAAAGTYMVGLLGVIKFVFTSAETAVERDSK